jgi:flagella basal body P-ring formation protein FlgA
MKRLFLTLLLCGVSLPIWAATQDLRVLQHLARSFVQNELSQRPKATFRLGRFDPNLAMPACDDPQVAWSDGAKPTGSSFVDIYCFSPVWRLQLPVMISEPRMGLVLTHQVQAGEILTPDDVQQAPLPDPTMNSNVLSDPSQVVGMSIDGGAPAGIWLRSNMVRPPVVVKMNQQVKVIDTGEGFSVEADGVALANGRAGDIVVVRMPNGQLLRGLVSEDGTVNLAN